MNLRLNLTVLMMLVSLSSYCQYPLVKTIGKDTVVIMTVKQGEDINKQFNALSDSISHKNAQLISLEKQFVEKQALFNSNVSILKQNIDSVGTENTFLKGEVERLKGLVWTEGKAARRHSVFMMVSFTTLIVLGFLISK